MTEIKGNRSMLEVCSIDDFMQSLKPWLSAKYIRMVSLNAEGNFVIWFMDGVRHVYRIESCPESRLREVLDNLKQKGIPVE